MQVLHNKRLHKVLMPHKLVLLHKLKVWVIRLGSLQVLLQVLLNVPLPRGPWEF